MDPSAFFTNLQQQHQFTPSQIQQIQQLQQQQQQHQQQSQSQSLQSVVTSTNQQHTTAVSEAGTTSSTEGAVMNGAGSAPTFQTMDNQQQQQGTNTATMGQPPSMNNSNNAAIVTNNALQMAILNSTGQGGVGNGAGTPFYQQLAALSGYTQQQQQGTLTDNMQKQQQGTATDANNGTQQQLQPPQQLQQQHQQLQLQPHQQQQMMAWNPQQQQQPGQPAQQQQQQLQPSAMSHFGGGGMNPFMMAPNGMVVPTATAPMNMQQQLQAQQFFAQQLFNQQLAAPNATAAGQQQQQQQAGNFNHLLSTLLAAQSGVMNPAVIMGGAAAAPGMMQPNTMLPPANVTMSPGFAYVPSNATTHNGMTLPPHLQQHQQIMMTAPNNPTMMMMNPTNAMKLTSGTVQSANDGTSMKVGTGNVGEVEWTKPFAAKVKKESPFPLKLFQILGNPECQECITWNPHGRSWRILKPPVFEQIVIPLYFRHAKYASFMRQVNGWGFKRVVTGTDHNSYYHELFVRDNPQLCLQMKRIKRSDGDDANGGGKSGSKVDDADDEEEDGDSIKKTNPMPTDTHNNAAINNTLPNPQQQQPTTLPTLPSPEDILKYAGMAGMLGGGTPPMGLNQVGGMVSAQPNFMLNNMLPTSALLGNPNAAAAMMNPMHFAGVPGVVPTMTNATTNFLSTTPQQQQPASHQQQSQSSTPSTVAVSNVTPITSTTNSGGIQPTMAQQQMQMLMNPSGGGGGVDSATLAKIQEIIASGGAETLLQQLQFQQQQQQQINGGNINPTAITNSNTSTNIPPAGSNTTDTSTAAGENNSCERVVKTEETTGENDAEDDDDDEDGEDSEEDDDDEDDDDDDDE